MSNVGDPLIDALWRQIESITPPAPILLPSTEGLELAPKPTPLGMPAESVPIGLWTAWGAVVGVAAALLQPGSSFDVVRCHSCCGGGDVATRSQPSATR